MGTETLIPNQSQPAPVAAPATVSSPAPAPDSNPAPVSPEVSAPVTVTPSNPAEVISAAGADTAKAPRGLGDLPEGETPPPAPEPVVDDKAKQDQPNPEGANKDAQPEAPKDPASQSVETAPLPTYEPFQVPEGMQRDDARLEEFTKRIGEFEVTTKADHAEVQKLAQDFVDRHIEAQQELSGRIHTAYQESWRKQTDDWYKSFQTDPEIGGNREETSIKSGIEVIAAHGGTPEQVAELRKMLSETGVGKHPALIRLMVNLQKSPLHREGRPLPAGNPPVKVGKPTKWYGSK